MLIIGIDVGTTGCKAIVMDESGMPAGSGYWGYGLVTGTGGRVEQDPQDWIRGMTEAVRQAVEGLDPSEIGALSLSTQAASSLLVDEAFRPLTPAITWMDGRAVEQRDALEKELGGEFLYRTTGWISHASLDMAKGLWLSEHETDLFQAAAYFVTTLEVMNHFLTGAIAIDPTNAAMRQMMDIGTNQWHPSILKAAGMETAMLPPILPTGAFLGCLTEEAAESLGLHERVKVYNGAHDQYCGALGAGILKPGEAMLSTGTAWVVMAVSEQPVFSSSHISPGPHVIPGLYGALASLPAAGASLDWLKNNITGGSYAEIDGSVLCRVEKSSDLFFLPFLAGACFPSLNTNAKAAFLGMDLDTDRMDLALACMEGVAFQLRMALDEYESSGLMVTDLRVTGGAVNSLAWTTILAAVCEKQNIGILDARDTPGLGAACIAAVGAGVHPDYGRAASAFGKGFRRMDADTGLVCHYQRKYRRYLAKWLAMNLAEEACDRENNETPDLNNEQRV